MLIYHFYSNRSSLCCFQLTTIYMLLSAVKNVFKPFFYNVFLCFILSHSSLLFEVNTWYIELNNNYCQVKVFVCRLNPCPLKIRSSVWDVFNNFLLINATDGSKISSDQKRFFIALSLYPLSFFANTPFNKNILMGQLDIMARGSDSNYQKCQK